MILLRRFQKGARAGIEVVTEQGQLRESLEAEDRRQEGDFAQRENFQRAGRILKGPSSRFHSAEFTGFSECRLGIDLGKFDGVGWALRL